MHGQCAGRQVDKRVRQFQARRRARAKPSRLEMLRKVARPQLTHPLLYTHKPSIFCPPHTHTHTHTHTPSYLFPPHTHTPTFSLHTALPCSAPHGDLLQHASQLLEAHFTLAPCHLWLRSTHVYISCRSKHENSPTCESKSPSIIFKIRVKCSNPSSGLAMGKSQNLCESQFSPL